MDIQEGNAGEVETDKKGWFVGFTECLKVTPLRYMAKNSLAHTLCIKWKDHKKADPCGQEEKPASDGRTISLLVSDTGRLRLEFSRKREFPEDEIRTYILKNRGDFVVWGENLYHRWSVEKKCSILTVRWIPVQPCS